MNHNTIPKPQPPKTEHINNRVGNILNNAEKVADHIYQIDVAPGVLERANLGFDVGELPNGYGFIGGAARNVLDALVHPNGDIRPPRDIDLVFGADHIQNFDEDQAHNLAMKLSPRDAIYGHGVQVIDDINDYINTRDFTINQVMFQGGRLVVSDQAAIDMGNFIIRPTDFVHNKEHSLGSKLALKAVRLLAELKADGLQQACIRGINLRRDTHDVSYSDFFQLLNLDKAFERGEDVAEQYMQELQAHKIGPYGIRTHDPIKVYKRLLGEVYDFEPSPHMTDYLNRERRLRAMGLGAVSMHSSR